MAPYAKLCLSRFPRSQYLVLWVRVRIGVRVRIRVRVDVRVGVSKLSVSELGQGNLWVIVRVSVILRLMLWL